eukprot:3397963-Rhodomonas_salina.2
MPGAGYCFGFAMRCECVKSVQVLRRWLRLACAVRCRALTFPRPVLRCSPSCMARSSLPRSTLLPEPKP